MLDNKKPIVTINLTPLVDVSLVLVVIFLATAPMFLQSGIIVTSGEKKSAPARAADTPDGTILIKLDAQGILVNQRRVSEKELAHLLRPLLSHSESKRVIISPEPIVRHGRLVRVMDLAKQAGAGALVILGKKEPADPEP